MNIKLKQILLALACISMVAAIPACSWCCKERKCRKSCERKRCKTSCKKRSCSKGECRMNDEGKEY